MEQLRQFGVSVIPLSDLVDGFCLSQGNMRQTSILAMYKHARWSWKELFRNTLWQIKTVSLCLDKDCTIKLPDNCERLLNISVVDCYGKLHPLGFNPDFNTTRIRCLTAKCSCDNCSGEGTLCGAIDGISVLTENVTIKGVDYVSTTLTRYNNGAVQTEKKIPSYSVESNEVVYNTLVETVCNVETTDKGCIKATQSNADLLRSYCGCGNFIDEWDSLGFGWEGANTYRQLMPTTYNYWGEFNFNAASPNIVHIFGGGRVLHYGHNEEQEKEWRSSIRNVIVSYQTNGEVPDEEILVPEYAVEAIEEGMLYRQKRLHPKTSSSEKRAAKLFWMAEVIKVLKYLNPIDLAFVKKLQTNSRPW